jgi:hypothetical protein
MTLLRLTDRGLYCEAGDFFVDPWDSVDRAVVTHAHSDHVAWGCRAYLTSAEGVGLLRSRLAPEARVGGLPYGQRTSINGVNVSLHPAGHILGSSQVRVEHGGEVFQLAFEGIQASSRHKSGIAVRFPRMARWRTEAGGRRRFAGDGPGATHSALIAAMGSVRAARSAGKKHPAMAMVRQSAPTTASVAPSAGPTLARSADIARAAA